MTDVLERAVRPRSDQPVAAPTATRPAGRRQDRPHEFSNTLCVLLASLSAGAGVIHLAMVPSHAGTSVVEGIGFAVAGWFQLTFAVVLFRGRSRFLLRLALLRLAVVVNVALIVAWVMSRTTGLPWGGHAWHPETVGFVDVACVAMEAGLVIVACALIARPRLGHGSGRSRLALGAIVPIGVLALATGALASPSARDHAGDSHGGHETGADDSSAGHAGHAEGPLTLSGEHVHGVKAEDIAAEEQPNQPLDASTRAALKGELTQARDVALRYPTVADATAAGYSLAGGFAPGSGAHYIGLGGGLTGQGALDPTRPMALIYDGTSPTSEITGLMYYGMGESAPEGFAGPNDHWHRHSNVCLKNGPSGLEVPFPADADVTAAQCADAQGNLMKITGWMVHAWVVPSWESPLGVFSHDNPDVRCSDGTYKTDKAGFCQGT